MAILGTVPQDLTGQKHVLTGAFGYTGSFVSKLLLARGAQVKTLTSKTGPVGGAKIESAPFQFDNLEKMAKFMEGAEVFYNTYWVRFNHNKFNHQEAVDNSQALFQAAKMAGVKKVVHISITNANLNAPWEYFRGKAQVEDLLKESGLSHAILRPAVLFGSSDILINNICWALRTFPVLGVFGWGGYRIRPIHVEDLAQLMVAAGHRPDSYTQNAVGPESYAYIDLVKTLAKAMGLIRAVVPCPPHLAYLVGLMVGYLKKDVFITWPEVQGLMAGYLDTPETFEEAPARTKLSSWAMENANNLGRAYASELARR